ncbi:chemotaxis protein CheW [Methylobacterium currus]|uniref:Chemotaxis protein CheW n=1 Tax=Methylobacterium currus TaxID=2051553 RepID=A0A2R4WK47_9HYPH|nr:chemotaxis protein CheW [Methylobacterium currus]AWB21921.1 chemotaxis protein CheW [Methylobacterium currus]UHC18466.1 chemotaxis protein CheW [Methylobacterium currus]
MPQSTRPAAIPAGPALPGEAALTPARIEEILEARTRSLATRGAAPEARPTRSLLVCRAGAETVGLPLEGVAEVFPFRPCTPVPGAPPSLVGLTGRGGILVSVIDLAVALGAAPAPAEESLGHVVALRRDGPRIGLRVERVLSVVEAQVEALAGTSVETGGLGRRAVAGYARAASPGSRQESNGSGSGFAVIDLASLLAPLLAAGRPGPA